MYTFESWKRANKSLKPISDDSDLAAAKNEVRIITTASHSTVESMEYVNNLRKTISDYESKAKACQDGGGLRFNEGKVKHQLIPGFAMNEVGKVFTQGAEKYGDNNWRRGMAWSVVLASASRHLNAVLQGEDFDDETGLLHSAHLATNAIFLTEYYRMYPQGDDRMSPYKNTPRIALDIDGVLADFASAYSTRIKERGYQIYPQEEQPHWGFPRQGHNAVWDEVKNDRGFWVNMDPICSPNLPIEPVAYVTARNIPVEWTHEWLVKHGFPDAKVFLSGDKPKSEILKNLEVDIFVDDCYANFTELNNAGICTFLFNRSYNRKYKVGHKRIYGLGDLIDGKHLSRREG